MTRGNELKPHIGIFGRRNLGKSSLFNFITGQTVAIVSDTPGTTTDPVKKSMELPGVGPVVWVDTAGYDDVGELGSLRVQRTDDTLPQMDLAIILFSDNRFDAPEKSAVAACRQHNIPFLLICSQTDRVSPSAALIASIEKEYATSVFLLSVNDPSLRFPLIEHIRATLPESCYIHRSLLGDVISQGDTVVMVTPIDSSAPEGRMILPQVQVLRDILDNNAHAVVCKETELSHVLDSLSVKPRLVITDSQVYGFVASLVPEDIFLTSFSVVLARSKGLFERYLEGTPAVGRLREGDRILLLESCTHSVTCEDIGRVKLPKLIAKYAGLHLHFDVLGGAEPITRPLSDYAMVVQCGGCVITAKQLAARLAPAIDAGVPVSNYGLMLAYVNGIFERSVRIFSSK